MRKSLAEHLLVEGLASGLEPGQSRIIAGHQCIDRVGLGEAFELNVIHPHQNVACKYPI